MLRTLSRVSLTTKLGLFSFSFFSSGKQQVPWSGAMQGHGSSRRAEARLGGNSWQTMR